MKPGSEGVASDDRRDVRFCREGGQGEGEVQGLGFRAANSNTLASDPILSQHFCGSTYARSSSSTFYTLSRRRRGLNTYESQYVYLHMAM